MREETISLWDIKADAIVVPCNWVTKRNGEAVMGAGVAKQAAERWPRLAVALGADIRASRLPYVAAYQAGDAGYVACFPTKRDWRDPADVDLIASNLPWLVSHAEIGKWRTVALPRLGCGLRTGQLDWATQVRPLLAELLDDRFVVVSPPASPPAPGSASEGAG